MSFILQWRPHEYMLRVLIRVGLLPTGTMARCTVNRVTLRAVVTFNGLQVEGGGPCEYTHPSPAARKPSGAASANGWHVWRLPDGRRLDDLRQQYRRGEY